MQSESHPKEQRLIHFRVGVRVLRCNSGVMFGTSLCNFEPVQPSKRRASPEARRPLPAAAFDRVPDPGQPSQPEGHLRLPPVTWPHTADVRPARVRAASRASRTPRASQAAGREECGGAARVFSLGNRLFVEKLHTHLTRDADEASGARVTLLSCCGVTTRLTNEGRGRQETLGAGRPARQTTAPAHA